MQRVFLEHLTKVFERPGKQTVRALSGLSLSVSDGECLALVGPSGSGKTTALRLIAGLEEPTSGTISIGGKVVNDTLPKARDVAMVFQNPALYPNMTVYQNLEFGLRLRKCPRSEAQRRVQETADILGLSSLLAAKPMTLSAGQRQRVALGRAMVRRASVLLLDEPLANVDPTLRAQMRAEIAQLRRRFGTTMVYVTHDHLEAMMIGDRMAVLSEGVLQQLAEPERVYRQPANLFVAGFVGAPPINLFSGALVQSGGALVFESAASQEVGSEARQFFKLPARLATQLQPLERVIVGLRSEHISLAAPTANVSSIATVQAKLLSIQTLGPDTYLRAGSNGAVFLARSSWPAGLGLTIEREYTFALDFEQACFFDPVTGERLVP